MNETERLIQMLVNGCAINSNMEPDVLRDHLEAWQSEASLLLSEIGGTERTDDDGSLDP